MSRNNLEFSTTVISSPDIDAATELPPEYVLLCLKRHQIYKGFFNRGLQQLWGENTGSPHPMLVKSSHFPPLSPSSPFRVVLCSLRPVGPSLWDAAGQLAAPRFFAPHPLLHRKHQQGFKWVLKRSLEVAFALPSQEGWV